MLKEPFDFLNSHIPVPRGTFESLSIYYELLLKWQNKINLIGPDTITDIWSRHFLDSLQLLKYIDDREKTIVDLGSGAGFPGMALAIYGFKNIHLIESDSRKIAFLREVARVTNTKISIHHKRIENCKIDNIDIFVSRALAPLDKLFHLISKSVSHETKCFFHKGKNYSIENENALLNWRYDMVVNPSIVDSQSVILEFSNIRKVL